MNNGVVLREHHSHLLPHQILPFFSENEACQSPYVSRPLTYLAARHRAVAVYWPCLAGLASGVTRHRPMGDPCSRCRQLLWPGLAGRVTPLVPPARARRPGG